MSVITALLQDIPKAWRVPDVYVGANWILALVRDTHGQQHAGVASTPRQVSPESRWQIGHATPDADVHELAYLLLEADDFSAAVGLAVLNAVHQPDESRLTAFDAADWLSEQSKDRHIAIFGRFPFIEDEIRPFARKVSIFEQSPQAGEFNAADMARILPDAELVAITSSTIINHTIDAILPHVSPGSTVVMLGPSTPLNERLFTCGIDALFGVRVVDVEQVKDSVLAGAGFQKVQGLKRVSLMKA